MLLCSSAARISAPVLPMYTPFSMRYACSASGTAEAS